MPQTTTDFTIGIPRPKLWSIFSDLKTLGGCVPGCEDVQIVGPDDSRWKVKLSVGIITKRIDAKAHIAERVEPEKLVVKIESVDGDITGLWNLQLQEEGSGATKVRLIADMRATGSFEWVINQVIKSQIDKMTRQFADCITKKSAVGS